MAVHTYNPSTGGCGGRHFKVGLDSPKVKCQPVYITRLQYLKMSTQNNDLKLQYGKCKLYWEKLVSNTVCLVMQTPLAAVYCHLVVISGITKMMNGV